MLGKKVLNKLITAINENKSSDVINEYIDLVAESIAEISKLALFYTLPFDTISSIVKKVDFNEENDAPEILRYITAGTNRTHKNEAILLLNDFSADKLPNLTIDNIIGIVSEIKSSALLTKLGELQEEENHLLVRDYEGEISLLNREISSLKEKLAENQRTDEFPPVLNQPENYEPDMFTALSKGNILSVQYNVEKHHFDLNSTIKCYLKEENCQIILSKDKISRYDDYECTPLHICCISNQLKIVQYLCEKQNINKESKDEYGWTPYSVSRGKVREYLESIGIHH